MLSKKQQKILTFPYMNYDALICDGAVRSGKTRIMTVAFIDWAMREFSGQHFGICAKTIESATKNIILPYMSMGYAAKRYKMIWHKSDKSLEVRSGVGAVNWFDVFGGSDESSFTLIQGRTFAGVLLDEVVLMPGSFVMQATARCSVEGSRLWFSCNPASSEHWFYKEWILCPEKHNALYLHFDIDDNPALPESVIARYKQSYSGVFYDRYILGKWVAAEGLVYDLREEYLTDTLPEDGEYYVSCDYGTMNPFSLGLWCISDGVAYRIDEYYYDGRASKRQLTDEEYYRELERLCSDYPIRAVIIDPSAASFIALIKQKGKFSVKKAKNDVIPGIRLVQSMFSWGRLKISRSCENAIREFKLYSWSPDTSRDSVVKENDHAMDEIRYFCMTVMAPRLRHRDERKLLFL